MGGLHRWIVPVAGGKARAGECCSLLRSSPLTIAPAQATLASNCAADAAELADTAIEVKLEELRARLRATRARLESRSRAPYRSGMAFDLAFARNPQRDLEGET